MRLRNPCQRREEKHFAAVLFYFLDIRLAPPYIESISRERPKMLGDRGERSQGKEVLIMKKKPAKKKKK
jgi:hypothetical protein